MIFLKKFPQVEIALNKRLYDEYHAKYHMTDGWDKGNKQDNFQRMMHLVELTGVPISGSSCLDVGCGTGDLSLFLRKRGVRRYVGIDIYDTSLQTAKKQYPDERFLKKDLLTSSIKSKFDYAFCSGTLTIKMQTIDNYDFLSSMVYRMWQVTKIGIVFNMLTDADPTPDPDLFFYNVKKVIKICQQIAPNAGIEIIDNEDKAQTHVYMLRK
jgi:ubiquinone/menaquinone biosynthesis C-methylase UbiE